MQDIVAASVEEKWQANKVYEEQLFSLIRSIVKRGCETGEFERGTPLDETCQAIQSTLLPLTHPVLLEQNYERATSDAEHVVSLAIRALIDLSAP